VRHREVTKRKFSHRNHFFFARLKTSLALIFIYRLYTFSNRFFITDKREKEGE